MPCWVWVLNAINRMGLLDASQCMGVSGAVYMVNCQGQLLQEKTVGSGQTIILTTHSTLLITCCICETQSIT